MATRSPPREGFRSRFGRPTPNQNETTESTSLFLANLPLNFRERDVYERVFHKDPNLEKIFLTVHKNENFTDSKGYCFIRFKTREAAQEVLDYNKRESIFVDKRPVTLNWARPTKPDQLGWDPLVDGDRRSIHRFEPARDDRNESLRKEREDREKAGSLAPRGSPDFRPRDREPGDDFRGPHGSRDRYDHRERWRSPRDDYRGPPGPRDDYRDFHGPPRGYDDRRGSFRERSRSRERDREERGPSYNRGPYDDRRPGPGYDRRDDRPYGRDYREGRAGPPAFVPRGPPGRY